MREKFDREKLLHMHLNRDYDAAIAYVDRFRKRDPTNEELRQQAARARTSKVEIMMMTADQIRATPPPPQLNEMIALLEQAVELEPMLADAHWNLAVLKARFQFDYQGAERSFGIAKQLKYRHLRMNDLEQLIQRGLMHGR